MLERLELNDVGPAPHLEIDLAPRLNLITGDNGLGKTFLLDVAWWALTRTWVSYPAAPHRGDAVKPTITYRYHDKRGELEQTSRYNLDPFLVEDGWFELDLDTLEVKPAASLEPAVRQRVEDTIARLKLNGRDCRSMRRRYFNLYWTTKGPIPLGFLEEQAPFLAREMRRQGRVRPEDLPPPAIA